MSRSSTTRSASMPGASVPFSFSGDCGVETTERSDRFDRIIGSEGQRHSLPQKLSPRVGMCRALGTEAGLGPIHVGEQVIGLHGGDYFQLLELRHLQWIGDLGVLDARP